MAKDLELELYRISSGTTSTLGILYIDRKARAFTVEDEYRFEKKPGETRIPAGVYPIQYRKAGKMLAKYQEKFRGQIEHPGMLELQGVPGFEFVYIHFGNREDETDGCILVNRIATLDTQFGGGIGGDSVSIYLSIYREISAALNAGRKVVITVRDAPADQKLAA